MALRVVWIAIAVLGIFLLAWPQIDGAVLLSDDTQLLFAHLPEPLFFHGWNSPTGFFRPIEIVSAYLVNPDGRDARMSLLLHIPAIIAIFAAMLVGLRRVTSEWRIAFPLAVLWWMFSVPTAITLWQPDVISQSWSGAIGAWTALLAWIGIDHVRQGQLPRPLFGAFIALCLAGVFTKEFYVGWAFGTVVMIAIAFALSSREERSHVRQWLAMPVPLALVAAAFVALRLGTGALVPSDGTGRYDLGLGLNVVENVAISSAGLLAVGPSHLISVPDASIVARASAPIGALLTLFMLVAAAVRVGVRRGVRYETALYGVLLAFAAVGPSLVTHHVSEYYLFGPNAIVACFVGYALVTLWRTARWPGLTPVVLGGLAVVWVGIALFGVYARAEAIAVHWEQVRRIDAEVNEIIDDARAAGEAEVRIVFPEALSEGPRHGVFFSTPTHLYDLPLSSDFLSGYTGVHVELVVDEPVGDGVELDVQLPARRAW
jgi:hypothetical protein